MQTSVFQHTNVCISVNNTDICISTGVSRHQFLYFLLFCISLYQFSFQVISLLLTGNLEQSFKTESCGCATNFLNSNTHNIESFGCLIKHWILHIHVSLLLCDWKSLFFSNILWLFCDFWLCLGLITGELTALLHRPPALTDNFVSKMVVALFLK